MGKDMNVEFERRISADFYQNENRFDRIILLLLSDFKSYKTGIITITVSSIFCLVEKNSRRIRTTCASAACLHFEI